MSKQPSNTFLIVDDEDLARAELCRQIGMLLPSFLGLEAANLAQARSLLMNHHVDGIFLDLEMPGGHGMTFLPEIREMQVPVVITTAHENFALEAFDADVTDYLLKPIEDSRLIRSLARMRPQQETPAAEDNLIILGDQNYYWPLDLENIIMAEAEGSYVTIHLKDRKPLLFSRSLKEIEQHLPKGQFVRVNRSQIVQLRSIQKIRRNDPTGFAAEIEKVGTIEFSRRQAQIFRQRYRI